MLIWVSGCNRCFGSSSLSAAGIWLCIHGEPRRLERRTLKNQKKIPNQKMDFSHITRRAFIGALKYISWFLALTLTHSPTLMVLNKYFLFISIPSFPNYKITVGIILQYRAVKIYLPPYRHFCFSIFNTLTGLRAWHKFGYIKNSKSFKRGFHFLSKRAWLLSDL